MNKIFAGFLFIFFSFNITFEAHTIDLVPTFVGYILLLLGYKEMALESDKFASLKVITIIMAIYTTAIYFLNLTGVFIEVIMFNFITGLLAMILQLVIIFGILAGLSEIEEKYDANLEVDRVRKTYIAFISIAIIAYILAFILVELALLFVIIGLVVAVVMVVVFNKTRVLYNNLPKNND